MNVLSQVDLNLIESRFLFEWTAFGWMIHSTAILGIAWFVSRLAGRRSADLRHGVWICAFVSLAILCVQKLTVPPFTFTLPNSAASQQNDSRIMDDAPSTENDLHAVAAAKQNIDRVSLPALEFNSVNPGLESGSAQTDIIPRAKESPTAIETARAIAASKKDQDHALLALLTRWAITLYFIGLAFWLAKLVWCSVRLAGIARRSAEPSMEPLRLAAWCAETIGLAKTPICRMSSEIRVPMMCGTFRPMVLLPSHFETLVVDQQRHCLLHEMAHVSHYDAWWNWLVELTTAVYWFDPLIYAGRVQYRRSREDAADDVVIRSGESAPKYSKTLLEVTQMKSVAVVPLSVAISASSDLETRIRRVLDPGLRCDRTPRWATWFLFLGFVLLASFGVTRSQADAQTKVPRSAESDRSDPPGEPIASQPTDSQSAPSTTTTKQGSEPPPQTGVDDHDLYQQFIAAEVDEHDSDEAPTSIDIVIQGKVSDADGPSPGAVVLIREFTIMKTAAGDPVTPPIIAKARTDEQGRYRVNGIQLALRKSVSGLRLEILAADAKGRLGLGVYGFNMTQSRRSQSLRAEIDISLDGQEYISGSIVQPDGTRISDVRLVVQEITVPGLVSIGQDPFSRARFPGFPPTPHIFRFPTPELQPTTRTDDQGRFSIPVVSGTSLVLGLRSEGRFPRQLRVSTPSYEKDLGSSKIAHEFVSPASIQLRDLLEISASVVDQDGIAIDDYRVAIAPADKPWSPVPLRLSKDQKLISTAEYFRESSDASGNVQMQVTFPIESNLLPLSVKVSADAIIAERNVRFVARRGTRASGRVVASDNRNAIPKVRIYWHQSPSRIDNTLIRCTTDPEGRWQMVIPKEAGFLSVVGQSDGLDLWTLERFNQQRTGHQRFSAPVPAREDAALSIPDFVIDRIPSRLISLVDSEGNPVSGGQVSAECIETMVQDGKVYRLNQPLAQPAITDSQGRCNLTLNRSNWEHGTIRVTKFSREDIPTGAGYTVAESTITPSDLSPIKLVLRRPWIVSGQVILDGRPATELIVGLEQKLQDQQGDFYWLKAGMDKVDDQGRFEISCVPGSDFEILLRRDTSGVTSVHRAKIPIQKVSSDHYTTGTISISSDQLRSVP